LITEEKKDTIQIEAMLSEDGVCNNKARILFRQLNQFLEKVNYNQNIKDVHSLLEVISHQ